VQDRIFADGKEGARRLEDMAAYYVEAIRKVQPHGPYCLVGYSFGGVVALEIAQQLYSAGERFVSVGPLDTDLTDNLPLGPGFDPAAPEQPLDWSRLILNFARHGTDVSVDDLKRIGSLEEQVAYAIERGVLPYNLDLETAMRYIKSGDVNSEAKSRYVAKPFHGHIQLFRALQGRVLECPDPTLGWGDVAAGGLAIVDVPGAHWNMMVKPHAQALANKVRPWLDRAQAQHSVAKHNAAAAEESLSRAK
jgi:thioesterase domain-containing protein